MKPLLFAAASLLALSNAAFAADQDYFDTDYSGLDGFSGNVHGGMRTLIDSGNEDVIVVPELRLGTKVAYEPAGSNFGVQFDLEYGGIPLSAVKPAIGASGSISDLLGVAHATFDYNDFVKFGIYGGLERLSVNVSDLDEDLLADLVTVDPGSVEASVKANMWQGGVEALVAVDDTSWMQIRAGVVDPYKLSASAKTATGAETGSISDSDNDLIGLQFGLGYRTALGENWSMRADMNYTKFLVSGASDISLWNWLATSQYSFDTVPVAWTASVGYLSASSGGDTDGAFIGRSSLIWTFGDAHPGGTRGKLFKAVNYQGDIN